MKKILLILLLILIVFTYSQKHNLDGSIWVCPVEEGSQLNYSYQFDSVTYSFYHAEFGEHIYGHYEVVEDTVIITEERGEYDHTFPKGWEKHKLVQSISTFKLFINRHNELGGIGAWDHKNKRWKKNWMYYTRKEKNE